MGCVVGGAVGADRSTFWELNLAGVALRCAQLIMLPPPPESSPLPLSSSSAAPCSAFSDRAKEFEALNCQVGGGRWAVGGGGGCGGWLAG